MATSQTKEINQIDRYYGLAMRQNTMSTPNSSDRKVNVALYTMKNNILAILHHSVQTEDPAKLRFCHPGENSWNLNL